MNVADAGTGAPLPDALVTIAELGVLARTNWLGEAQFDAVPRRRLTITVRHIGYVPATVEIEFSRDTVGYVFVLAPAPPVLDTVRATAKTSTVPLKHHEFEIRRAMGIGRFLTDSILQREHTQPIASIIARHFPGFYSVGFDRSVTRFNCGRPDVYIDGARYGIANDALDLRSIVGDDVAGVEYYTQASAPVQYRRLGMGCGVLLIWLRF